MSLVDAYFEAVRHALATVHRTQREALEQAANWLAETLARDGLLYVTGSGHSHMLAEEVFYRAGGLMAVQPLLEPSLMLHAGALKSTRFERLEGVAEALLADTDLGPSDLLVVASNSGRNAYPIEIALGAKARGCRVVAITSRAHSQRVTSRHPSGARLFELADLVIDNGAPYGDASLDVDGTEHRVGPLSSLTGILIMNAVVARAVELRAAAGRPPQVFVSANVERDASQPDAAQTDAPQRDASQPETSQPEAPQHDASQPEASQPEAPQQDAPQPEATQPDATQPHPAERGIPQSDGSERDGTSASVDLKRWQQRIKGL